MELIQFYSGMIFLALGVFLFLEERNFKKNLIKITGRVVGYSKGKSKTNKRHMYPVIEFLHPSGERGWVESHKIFQAPGYSIGAEIPLVADKDDFHIARASSSLSSVWAGIFIVLAVADLFSFTFFSKAGWELSALTLLFIGAAFFLVKDSWYEQDENFKIVSAWRAWRLQIVKSRVYSEAEVKDIQFWDREYCLKVFKRANRFRAVYLIMGLLFTGNIFFMGLQVYFENEQFYSNAKKATATILKMSSNGKPTIEYYDIEGVSHRVLGRYDLRSRNIKAGDRLNVLYNPNQQGLRFDTNEFIYFDAVMIIGFALLMGLEFAFFHSRMPKFDLNSPLITTSEELIMKKAS